MKKMLLTVFICFLICLFGLSVNAQSQGDVNNSGVCDIVDALVVAQFYVGLNPPNFIQSVADVNCSGTIDIIDALIIAQFYVGLIPLPPCQSTPGPTVVPVEPGVLLSGRFDHSDPAGPKFGWSATTIKANFNGTQVSVKLSSTGDNWINVTIDNIAGAPINVPAGSNRSFLLASGLQAGPHTVEIVRRTEAWVGDMQFLGFDFGSGTLLAPPTAPPRRIEFIGDSITCGYGNEGENQYQSFTTGRENAYLAYGSVTARLLDAEQVTVSWSGKGVIRNYGGDRNDVLPSIYDRILPYNTSNLWNSANWTPHVAVINLCTNDYSIGIPDRTEFVTAYKNFVQKIRTQYPGAHIYCAIGPMLGGENLVSARDFIGSVVDSFNAAGDNRVRFIEFPQQDPANGYGEDWHPSVKTHALMAAQLAARIRVDLGW